MLDLVLIFVYAVAMLLTVGYAFVRPNGIYWRSAASVALTALAGAALWALASPTISNEAGLGAFALWFAAVLFVSLMAAAACLAATLRHALNALGARAL
jgi:hypothetical protein